MEDLQPPETDFPNPPANDHVRLSRWLALAQGSFYVVTGIWPLLHLRSFLWVTGPKTDVWLVQTFGAVLAVIGAGIASVGGRRRFTTDWIWLSLLLALVLAACDVVFVLRGAIRPIYLGDAAVEFVFVVAWLTRLRR